MDTTKLHNLAISDTGFIFDPVSGNSFSTNETGLLIIKELKNDAPVDRVISAVVECYEVPVETAKQDVLQMIESLRSDYLL
jgi:hypothetical protein